MTKENIYDLIKAHATELVDGHFRFKKVDLKEACAELEDCFKRLHKPVVGGPWSDVRSEGEPLPAEGQAQNGSVEGWCDYFVDRRCDCKKGDFCKGTL